MRPFDGCGFFGAGADGETTGAVGCVFGVTLGVTAGVAVAGADGLVAGWLLPVCFFGGAIVAASASERRLIVATKP